jgi:ribosome-binding protein aMBF1 (putative translation factor)
MPCELCGQTVSARTKVRIYGTGIWVGQECGCYNLIEANRHKPYSNVMDRVAMAETGYHANRKIARLRLS